MKNSLSLVNYWLEKIVIGLNLCPFAKTPWEKGLIRVSECESSEEDDQVDFFLEELELLYETSRLELSTTLIVYPGGSDDFLEFNDFVGQLEMLLEEAELKNIFQLVAFHPRFMFLDTSFDDAQNLVNRSPFPIIHILRSEDLERARLQGIQGEDISFFNESKLKAMDEGEREKLFYYLKDFEG